MIEKSKVCMIGGSGRSGTTILNKIYSNHPKITSVPEWRFLIDPDGIIDFYINCEKWSPYHYDIRLKRLETLLRDLGDSSYLDFLKKIDKIPYIHNNIHRKMCPRYVNTKAVDASPNYLNIVDNLIGKLISFKYSGEWVGIDILEKKELYYASPPIKENMACILGDFLQEIITDVLQYQNADYYLEKNTWNILWFDKILELIPQAKMVHIYRDPRDVIASYTKQSWMPSDPIKSAIIYKDVISKWNHIKMNLPKGTYLEVSLESLVSKPQENLNLICDFWGIPWSDSLLEIDLSKSNSGRWKEEFDIYQIEKIEKILYEEILHFNYIE